MLRLLWVKCGMDHATIAKIFQISESLLEDAVNRVRAPLRGGQVVGTQLSFPGHFSSDGLALVSALGETYVMLALDHAEDETMCLPPLAEIPLKLAAPNTTLF